VLKDLGIIIDEELSFNNHIYDRINAAFKMLGIINRNFVNLEKSTFILLYKSLVRSLLEYGNSVWNPHKTGLIHDLEKVQKRATKLLPLCRNKSYSERLKFLNLPCLRYRRIKGT